MSVRACFIVVFAICTFSTSAIAASPEVAANAFDKGEFSKAVQIYRELAKDTPNGHVYYNLGLSHYRLGEKGEAMAAFLAARRFLPRDPDVKANLNFTLKEIPDDLRLFTKPTFAESFVGWSKGTTLKEMGWICAVLWFVGGVWISFSMLLKGFRPYRTGGLIYCLLPLLSTVGFGVRAQIDMRWGAVVVSETSGYSDLSKLNKEVFKIREGAPFAVRNEINNWYQIELSDGKTAWVESKDVKVY